MMRAAAVFSEAVRDVLTGTSKVLLFSVVFALLLGAGYALAVGDRIRALDEALVYRASGASVTFIRAEARVQGSACDALAQLPGVRAAGGIRAAAEDVTPRALPRTSLPTKEITPGFRSVVVENARTPASGVFLSEDVATALGLRHGEPLETSKGPVAADGRFRFPDDGRQGDLGYSVLVPQIPEDRAPYDECWVDVWPESEETTALLRTTLLPGPRDSERPTTRQLNARFGAGFTGADAIANGASRFAAGGTALGGFILGVVSTRLRRLELASAQHAGVSRAAQAFGQLVQGLTWISAGTVLMAPVALAFVQATDEANGREVMVGTHVVACGALAAIAGVIGSTLITRENDLFRYFKQR